MPGNSKWKRDEVMIGTGLEVVGLHKKLELLEATSDQTLARESALKSLRSKCRRGVGAIISSRINQVLGLFGSPLPAAAPTPCETSAT